MRKIPSKYENPFDNFLINMAEYFSPYAYKIGMTPNILTTISLFFCIITVALLYNYHYYIATAFFLLSYFFDCFDGYFARKYNQTTKFGDFYDHICDCIKNVAILFTLYYLNSTKFLHVLSIIFLFFCLSMIQLGCQESFYNKSSSIEDLKLLCPSQSIPLNKLLLVTRYFGCGTANLIVALSFIYYDF